MPPLSDPHSLLAELEQRTSLAHQDATTAREAFERAEQAERFWVDLNTHYGLGHHASALLTLGRGEADIRAYEGESADKRAQIALIDAIKADCEGKSRAAIKNFVREFPKALLDAGITLDQTSRHPVYTFKNGFVRVEVDDHTFTARVKPRDGGSLEIGADIPVLVEAVISVLARLFTRELQAEAVLKSIYTAYLAILRADKLPDGELVPLRRVTNRMSKNLSHFAADEFNIDLSRIVQSGNMTIDGMRMYLNHTKNIKQGMLLWGLEDRGYVGFVSFRKHGDER